MGCNLCSESKRVEHSDDTQKLDKKGSVIQFGTAGKQQGVAELRSNY